MHDVVPGKHPSARFFPHHAAGFRSNPFRALTDAEWAALAIISPEIEAVFRRPGPHLQFGGGLGAGKTTTLLGLMRLAQDDGRRVLYEYVPEGQSHFAADLARCDLFLLDEAQRLSPSECVRLLRWCGGALPSDAGTRPRLVCASHRDLAPQFAAHGLPLATFSVDALALTRWRAMLDARIAAAALRGRPHATLADDAVALVAQTFGRNRRAAVSALYEVFQQVRAPEVIDATCLRALLATGSDAPSSGTA